MSPEVRRRTIDGRWARRARPDLVTRVLSGATWHWGEIPASPVLDTNSAAMMTTFNTDAGNQNKTIATYDYGVPIWEIPANVADTPVYAVPSTKYFVRTVQGVRIPDSASPQPNSPTSGDGAMVVIDYNQGKVYEFYEAWKNGANWTAGSLAVYSMGGVGTNDADTGVGMTGAGLSRALGLITRADLARAWPNGDLGHALVFSSSVTAPTVFRYPAIKTDGSNLDAGATPIPEGARMQLDPAYDVNGSNLSNLHKVIARTLQKYGAYNIDNGGSRLTFNLEGGDPNEATYNPPLTPGRPYSTTGWAYQYGITSNYTSLNAIPWSQCRILKNWHGGA